jgi:hypothetical protein
MDIKYIFFPTQCPYAFCVLLTINNLISLSKIHLLVFLNETHFSLWGTHRILIHKVLSFYSSKHWGDSDSFNSSSCNISLDLHQVCIRVEAQLPYRTHCLMFLPFSSVSPDKYSLKIDHHGIFQVPTKLRLKIKFQFDVNWIIIIATRLAGSVPPLPLRINVTMLN